MLLPGRRDLGVNRRSAASRRGHSDGDRHCVLLDGCRMNMCGRYPSDIVSLSLKLDIVCFRCGRAIQKLFFVNDLQADQSVLVSTVNESVGGL